MSTKGIADVVFCLDASDSMRPCFDAMRAHIGNFVSGLTAQPQTTWDWRIDFVAHSTDGRAFRLESTRHDAGKLIHALYQGGNSNQCFTTNLDEFRRSLKRVTPASDEAPLVALDVCLDFPWRSAPSCHRAVVLMTDEPFETGVLIEEQSVALQTLIDKIQRLHVLLYIVAPESDVFSKLAATHKAEYDVVDQIGQGLAGVNYERLLTAIGKSVSLTSWQMAPQSTVPRGIFGQAAWTETQSMEMRDRTK